jgi:large subunit ribosomal protein L24
MTKLKDNMKIKVNDKVKISTGKDKGKVAKVLQVFPDKNRASVEGVNLLVKHMRPRRQGEKGQRIEFPAPMDLSNLMLTCPKCGKEVRVAYQYSDDKKKKYRVCKKCNQVID